MKHMKKILLLFTAIFVMGAVAACGNNDTTEGNNNEVMEDEKANEEVGTDEKGENVNDATSGEADDTGVMEDAGQAVDDAVDGVQDGVNDIVDDVDGNDQNDNNHAR